MDELWLIWVGTFCLGVAVGTGVSAWLVARYESPRYDSRVSPGLPTPSEVARMVLAARSALLTRTIADLAERAHREQQQKLVERRRKRRHYAKLKQAQKRLAEVEGRD